MKKLSLVQFFRDAAHGMQLELVEWNGKTGEEIPERLRGLRPVSSVHSQSITLRSTTGGEDSYLWLERASLVEYDGKTLTVYNPALREVTPEERAELDKCRKMLEEYNEKNPFSSDCGYWKRKDFFKNCPTPWMDGADTIKGKRYIQHEDKVLDYAIKGDKTLKYNVFLEGNL